MAKAKISKPGLSSGSRGGRKPEGGERYPSGKLKQKVEPNPEVLARRLAICGDYRMASCPLDAAYANGWISGREHFAGQVFVSIQRSAGLGGPTAAAKTWEPTIASRAANDINFRWSELTDAQVRGMKWNELTDAEIASIFDSAMPVQARSEDGSSKAHRRWREICAAMTPLQRSAVDSFCIRETWPRWLTDRLQGEEGAGNLERARLRDGLRVVADLVQAPTRFDGATMPAAQARPSAKAATRPKAIKPAAANDHLAAISANDDQPEARFQDPAAALPTRSGRSFRRVEYVDDENRLVLKVEVLAPRRRKAT